MDQISIELADDLTLGALRSLAAGMGKRLVISLENGERPRRVRPPGRLNGTPGDPRGRAANGRRRRRKLSPEARAALARNLEKARAARWKNLKAAKKGKARKAGKS